MAENKTNDANDDLQSGSGPQIAESGKETKHYGKRIILIFILGLGMLLILITTQAKFGNNRGDNNSRDKNYRAPQASGFADLAAGIRRDRQPVTVTSVEPARGPEKTTPRIVVRSAPAPVLPPAPPRYYSDKSDSQAAAALRTLKLQALAAEPVAASFKTEADRREANASEASRQRGAVSPAGGGVPAVMDTSSMNALLQQAQQEDPNGQNQKFDFLRNAQGGGSLTPQGYSENLPIPQQFPYELKAGTIIPGIMLTGINSDLPGNIIGQVSENVWDTATGRYVLIPKATRILGVYDSHITFGQRRILIVWNRLVFPNGMTLNIAGSPGVDQAGYSGLSGRLNEHWGDMLKAALLASVFVAGAEMVYERDTVTTQGGLYGQQSKSPSDIAAESVSTSILDMGAKITDRAANIQPTITIRPGKRMGIFVEKDIVFPFPYF